MTTPMIEMYVVFSLIGLGVLVFGAWMLHEFRQERRFDWRNPRAIKIHKSRWATR